MEKVFCAYILASQCNGTLYIVTSNLVQRVWQHKDKAIAGFRATYGADKLFYFERHESSEDALQRERQLKKRHRARKLRLIEECNPRWRDVYADIV